MIHWSRSSSFILVTAALAFGGFLLGKSSSDDKDKNEDRRGAEGRFQLVATPNNYFIVFDTRTARGWAIHGSGQYPGVNANQQWKVISSPFDVPKARQEAGGDEPAKKFGNVADQLKGEGDKQRRGDEAEDKPNVDENAANKPPFRKIKTRIIDGKPTTNGR